MIKHKIFSPTGALCMLFSGLIAASTSVTAAPDQSQIDALKSIYDSLNGQQWTDKVGWDDSDPCTGWSGVTCDATGTNVTKLIINGNNAFGVIPSDIADLSELEELVITAIGLRNSTIPASIGNLTKLKGLYLNDNGLEGNIPTELGQLPQLENLSLDDNQLSGPIPIELMSLTKLYGLRLHHNYLSGSIPEEISNLTQLRALTLHRNGLSGEIPATIADLPDPDLSINLEWNALHTFNATVSTFINQRSAGDNYIDTQTLDAAPNRDAEIGETAVRLYWDQRNTTPETDGGYKVYIATDAAGPYALNQTVESKSSDSARVDGLNANTTYFFQIRSYTSPHEDNPQPTNLVSDGLYYAPKEVTTLAAGSGNEAVSGSSTDNGTDTDGSGETSTGGGGGSMAWLLLALGPIGLRGKRRL